jgi:hypothetical protein
MNKQMSCWIFAESQHVDAHLLEKPNTENFLTFYSQLFQAHLAADSIEWQMEPKELLLNK